MRATKVCFAVNRVFVDTHSITDTIFDSSSGGRKYKIKFYNTDIPVKTLFVLCTIKVRQQRELVLFFTILGRGGLEKKSNAFRNFTVKRYACFFSILKSARNRPRFPWPTFWRFTSSVLHKKKKNKYQTQSRREVPGWMTTERDDRPIIRNRFVYCSINGIAFKYHLIALTRDQGQNADDLSMLSFYHRSQWIHKRWRIIIQEQLQETA